MRIGVYGGVFDPIHYGHLRIAETAREHLGLDKVLLIPSGTPVHRSATQAPAEDRYTMCLLAARDNPSPDAVDRGYLALKGPRFQVPGVLDGFKGYVPDRRVPGSAVEQEGAGQLEGRGRACIRAHEILFQGRIDDGDAACSGRFAVFNEKSLE